MSTRVIRNVKVVVKNDTKTQGDKIVYGEHDFSGNKIILHKGSLRIGAKKHGISVKSAEKNVLEHEMGHAATRKSNKVGPKVEAQANAWAKRHFSRFNKFWKG